MIIAIERNKFNYLYKYNEVVVDNVHVGNIDILELAKLESGSENLVFDFSRMLPYFEEDHEVILLDVDESQIRQGDQCLIYFNAVLSIYPLTTLASKLLEGRLNSKFRVQPPIFEHIVEAVKLQRSLHTRLETIKVLFQYFGLSIDVQEVVPTLLYEAARNVVSQKKESNYFEHLLSYNKTPSYVPEGNVEYLCKIGIVALRSLGQNEDSIVKGPFYKSCIANKSLINKGDLFESYNAARQLPDDSFQQSFKKIVEAISKSAPEADVFRISYFFIAFRDKLLQNEKNLTRIERDIKRLTEEHIESAKWVVALLGFAFSFENLYESIHTLNKAPLFIELHKYQGKQKPANTGSEPSSYVIQKDLERFQSIEKSNIEEPTPPTLANESVIENQQSQKHSEVTSKAPTQPMDASSDVQNPRMILLKKLVLFEKIQKILEKKDAKAWIKHLGERFPDSDELSWTDVKLSITKSKAKHFKESNQNHVRGFFEE